MYHREYANLHKYLQTLVSEIPSLQEIWLIGSLANGTERVDSDWDLLVFSDQAGYKQLQMRPDFKRENVDLLVVFDGENFEEPWPDHYENRKSGTLTGWCWKRTGKTSATYESTKFIPDEDCEPWFKGLGTSVTKILDGVRLLPK
ncbi:MAG: putative nucleotidyltransferase [Alcanivorax sp.]|jgi:predicted nucleotidyltransferase